MRMAKRVRVAKVTIKQARAGMARVEMVRAKARAVARVAVRVRAVVARVVARVREMVVWARGVLG